MEGEVTACVVSYYKGKHTLVLHVDTKLHIMTIKPSVLAALSSGAVRALGEHIVELASDRRQDAANQPGDAAVLPDGAYSPAD